MSSWWLPALPHLMIRHPGFDCCLNQSPSFLKIKLMHLLLIKAPFCSVLLTLHRLCLHWSTGAGCLHSLSLFNFHRSPVSSLLYHFLSRFCMLSVEMSFTDSWPCRSTTWGLARQSLQNDPWTDPAVNLFAFSFFNPPQDSLISWPYMKNCVGKYIPKLHKLGYGAQLIWTPLV